MTEMCMDRRSPAPAKLMRIGGPEVLTFGEPLSSLPVCPSRDRGTGTSPIGGTAEERDEGLGDQRPVPRPCGSAGGRRRHRGGGRGGAVLAPQARQASRAVRRLGAPGARRTLVPPERRTRHQRDRRGELLLRSLA